MSITIIYLLCLAAALTQCWFWLNTYVRLKHKPAQKSKAVNFPPVSVVVCAHNEEEYLGELLTALSCQQYPTFEIILVNDRSTDLTADLAEQYRKTEQRLQVLHLERTAAGFNPKKYALQQGINAARYEYILLTDADCKPRSSHWISEMISAAAPQAEMVLGYGPYEQRAGFLNSLIRFETLYTGLQYLGWAVTGKPYMGVGRNLMYKKSLFLKNGGFGGIQGVLGGDDDLFVGKVAKNTKINTALSIDSQTISKPCTTWKAWFKQKRRHYHSGLRYGFVNKIVAGFIPSSQLILLFSLLVEVFYLFSGWILLIFILRTSFFVAIFVQSGKRVGEHFTWREVLLAELSFPFLYLIIGITAVIHTKPRWN